MIRVATVTLLVTAPAAAAIRRSACSAWDSWR